MSNIALVWRFDKRGQIDMSVTSEQIKVWLEEGMPDADIKVVGDGRHFEAKIITDAFIDKSKLERHRIVYAALGDKMQSTIHALSMQTLTRTENEE